MQNVVPINALFDESFGPNIQDGFDARALMRDAEVIVAVDVMSQKESLVYGRKLLTEMHLGKIPWRDVLMLKVSLDTKSEEFTKLLLLVLATKNVVDYRHYPTAAAS